MNLSSFVHSAFGPAPWAHRPGTSSTEQYRVPASDCGLPGRDPSYPSVCRAQIGFWWSRGVLGCRITCDSPRLPKFIVRTIIRLLIREYVKGALSHKLEVAEWHFLASYMALNHCTRADTAADNLSQSMITIEGRCFLQFSKRCIECRRGIAMRILSVRRSIRLSNPWFVAKRKNDVSRFLYHTIDHLA